MRKIDALGEAGSRVISHKNTRRADGGSRHAGPQEEDVGG